MKFHVSQGKSTDLLVLCGVQDTLLSPNLTPFFLSTSLQVAAAITATTTVLQMGTPRTREVGQLAQDHVTRKCQSQQLFLPAHQAIRDDPVKTVHCLYWVNLRRNGCQAT